MFIGFCVPSQWKLITDVIIGESNTDRKEHETTPTPNTPFPSSLGVEGNEQTFCTFSYHTQNSKMGVSYEYLHVGHIGLLKLLCPSMLETWFQWASAWLFLLSCAGGDCLKGSLHLSSCFLHFSSA